MGTQETDSAIPAGNGDGASGSGRLISNPMRPWRGSPVPATLVAPLAPLADTAGHDRGSASSAAQASSTVACSTVGGCTCSGSFLGTVLLGRVDSQGWAFVAGWLRQRCLPL